MEEESLRQLLNHVLKAHFASLCVPVVCARVEERGVEESRCRKCKETFDLSCVLCKNQAEPTQPHHRFDKLFGIKNGDVR